MAVWQISFQIVPENSSLNELKEENFSWKENTNNIPTENIKNEFGIADSWSNNLTIFGKLDKTCIEILKVEDEEFEISCKYDVFQEDSKSADVILDFMKDIKGEIYIDGEIYSPTLENFIEILRNSEAAKFAKDQEGYFRNKLYEN